MAFICPASRFAAIEPLKDGLLSPKPSHTKAVQDFCHALDGAGLQLLLDAAEPGASAGRAQLSDPPRLIKP